MSDTITPILVCKHGQQARVCETCDLERENARLCDVLAEMSKQLAEYNALQKNIEDQQA